MLQPINVYATDVIGSMFNPDDKVCLRVFADKKGAAFTGMKLEVEAGKYRDIISDLQNHNQQNRCISFVVNYGGHTDADITRVNAQFMECDNLPFDEQETQIMAFPLKPSLIIKTRKSYHTYWYIKDGDVSRFRAIQKALAKHFNGDATCVNESKALRLPGFYHCKEDPVLVEVVWFHPEYRYTQDELAAVLPEVADPTPVAVKKGDQAGLEVMMNGCDFIQHCVNDAATLSEPEWFAMISNMAVFDGGSARIHEVSQPYPNYTQDETDKKIQHVMSSGAGPITCQVIADNGFACPKRANGTCDCKSPAAMSFKPLDIDTLRLLLQAYPVKGSAVDDLQASKEFIEKYMYNCDVVTAESFIKYDVKNHFNLKSDDIKMLITYQKNAVKLHQANKNTKMNGTELPPWYTLDEKGHVKFMPGVLADEMAKAKDIFVVAGTFNVYDNGVYQEVEDLRVKNMVREQMISTETKLSQITDATEQLKMQTIKGVSDLNSNPYIINVKNGLYNVLDDTMYEHTKDYLSTIQLPVNYSPGAECPRFIQYLHEVLPEDQIPLVQEILGYLLIPVTHAQKCFVLVGKGDTGKSQMLSMINDILLGKKYVSNVSWQALSEKFKQAELYGKLANIFADLPKKKIDDNDIFKALVGEDHMTVEKKGKDPFSMLNKARLVFSCNSIPRNYEDKSEGFYRRLIILRFDNVIPKDKKDRHLQDKFKSEADGIFMFAVEGLKRLINNKYEFSVTDRNLAELSQYREDNNNVLAFVHEWCEIDDEYEYETASMELYDKYQLYCKVCGMSPLAQRKFSEELGNAFPQLRKCADKLGKRRTWRGIKVSDDTME